MNSQIKWVLILYIFFLIIGCKGKKEHFTPVFIHEKRDFSLWIVDKKGEEREIYKDIKPIGLAPQYKKDSLLYGITREGKNIIYGLNLKTGERKELLETDIPAANLVSSNDGKRIAFVSQKEIWMMEIGSDKLKKMVSLSTQSPFSFPYSLSFSPKGDKIAFLWGQRSAFNADLWIIDCKTRDLQRLTFENNIFFQDNPLPLSWSREGDKIIVFQTTDKSAGKGIMVSVDIKNKTRRRYIFEGINIDCFRPVFSPDGGKILFVGYRKGEVSNLWQISLKKEELGQLTRFKEANVCGEVSYSPDGTKIAFGLFDGNYSIWSVSRDGTSLKRVTKVSDNEEDYHYPVWLSDEKLGFLRIQLIKQ